MARPSVPREFRRLAQRLGGGRLVYARPLRVGDRAVIPVARVRMMGGFGWGSGTDQGHPADGGGGGGVLGARPVGFIDVGPEGARYEAIPPPRGRAGTIAAGVAAGALVGTAVVGSVLGARAVTRLWQAALPTARRAVRWSSRRAPRPWPRR